MKQFEIKLLLKISANFIALQNKEVKEKKNAHNISCLTNSQWGGHSIKFATVHFWKLQFFIAIFFHFKTFILNKNELPVIISTCTCIANAVKQNTEYCIVTILRRHNFNVNFVQVWQGILVGHKILTCKRGFYKLIAGKIWLLSVFVSHQFTPKRWLPTLLN